MNLKYPIPPDDFLAYWLEANNYRAKPAIAPICYLSRQGRKTRRIKNHLENYIFITDMGSAITADQLRAALSAYLHLNYHFQLIQMDNNKFVLTLETAMQTDYACAVLEEGKMVRLAGSDVLCYPTDEYAEGFFGGNLMYDMDDEVADMYLDIQIHAVPLHLRTLRAIERILLRYCVVHVVDDDCLSSKRLDCVSCACWAQRGTMFPKYIIIKVAKKFSHDSQLASSILHKHVQTYCVGVTVKSHGWPHPKAKYQLQNDTVPFYDAAEADRIGCCFLRDVDVCRSRITELRESILLKPKELGLQMTEQDIAAELQSALPCINGRVTVQSIGVQGYIERSNGQPLPHLLPKVLQEVQDIHLSSQAFSWLPWSTSFGAVKETLPRKINIQTRSLPAEFVSPTIIEDLLSPFCMFDTGGYNPGSSPDITNYNSVVWTDSKRVIPSIIIVHAAPTFCETMTHPKGEVVELTVLNACNLGIGLEEEE